MTKPTDSNVVRFRPKGSKDHQDTVVTQGVCETPNTAEREPKGSLVEGVRGAGAPSPTKEKRRRTRIRHRATLSLGWLSDSRIPVWVRLLLVMEQSPTGVCGWGYESLATATGLSVDAIKAPLSRLVKEGRLERVSKGVFKVLPPPAGEGTLKVLNDQTGSLWTDVGDDVSAPLVPAGGWLEIPLESPAMKVLGTYMPWVLDSENADAKAFWVGLGVKSRKLASRLKRDVPGALVAYLLLRPLAAWLQANKGDMGNVRSAVGTMLYKAGSATPKNIDVAAWTKAEEALEVGGPTVASLFGGIND